MFRTQHHSNKRKQTRAARLKAMIPLDVLTKEYRTANKPVTVVVKEDDEEEFTDFLESHLPTTKDDIEELSSIIAYEPVEAPIQSSTPLPKPTTIKRGRLKKKDAALHPELYQKSSVKHRDGIPKYECSICDKAFVTISKLEVHHLSHLPREQQLVLKKFHCEYCPRTFREQNKLNNHRNFKHFKNYKFICDICGKPFINSSELKRHKTQSHAERQPCTICSKQVLNLELHFRDVHENSPKTCGVCNEVLPNQKKLNKHRFKHHPFQIFECEICEKTYNERFCYKKHMNEKHGITIQEDLIF